VPVRLGFVGADGNALPLTLEGENATGPDERVLELTEAEESFVFVDVAEEPLISIGRGFSAPAHFRVPLDRKARAALMGRDRDTFNRWEAGQALATEILLDMAETAKTGSTPTTDPIYLDAIGAVLAGAESDPAFAALMLVPPLESELAMAKSPIDPDAIHAARVAHIRCVAQAHATALEALYRKATQDGTFSPDAASAGLRSLRNATLRYLTAADDDAAAKLADAHYRRATNMTDMIAGLAALSRMNSPLRDAAFASFYDRFRNDPLVLDKWLALQAGSPLPGTLAGVRTLMRHPAFDIKNPNRVRSLVGTFAGNHLRFHAKDGEGYRFLGETLRLLDGINPQVAARMSGAFENWRRYDTGRQALMRAEIEALSKLSGASANLFEVTTKMLG
jgi:aminopeptidase N